MSQKDFMGAEDVEYLQKEYKGIKELEYVTPPQYTPSSIPTDVIISGYENKISQNIAAKTLAAAKRGEPADFTKEELLYLNKKSGENEDVELKVITPTPAITLKKGKTELNIGHAAILVQKMEEKYPTGPNKRATDEVWQGYKNEPVVEQIIPSVEEPLKVEQQPIKTVNKNAYEIREAVLSHALSWVQYTRELGKPNDPIPTEDDVLNVAQKFYKFVENRR